MTIIHGEEGACRPVLNVLEGGSGDVEDDGYSVFVIISIQLKMR